MAKGRKLKGRPYNRRLREEDERTKGEAMKRVERGGPRTIPHFRSEELQEICSLLNIDELLDDHHCFLGAVVIGKFEVVKRLLKEGHSIDFLDENHETALMLAVKHFRLEMVDFLVARGADVSPVDGDGNTAVLLAAQGDRWDQDTFSGLWTAVRSHPRLQPALANKAGYTLLHYVTKRQWASVLVSLLAVPVPLDCVTGRGVTPLIIAASRGDAVIVQALLAAGADVALEDQQCCTALCYAIAFSLQKNLPESNRALERLLAATHGDQRRLPLETYLQRRVEVLVSPPRPRAEYSRTVSGVLVHVFTFFARFVYSGLDLLLELSVFHKLREAIERHLEESQYVAALLAVVLELVRHCSCCSQGVSQAELADAFFTAELPKALLHVLHRYSHSKSTMVKAVFLPLTHVCSSDCYRARVWLERHHHHLHSFYNRYTRACPAVFLETNGDPHLEIEKRCSQAFQTIMRTLKTKGKIVTEEEHSKAQKNAKRRMAMVNYENPSMKETFSNRLAASFKRLPEKNIGSVVKRHKLSKVPAIYSSVQHSFGKLEFVKILRDSPKKEETETSKMADVINSEKGVDFNELHKTKKSRIEINEVQPTVDNAIDNTNERLGDISQKETHKESKNDGFAFVSLERKELTKDSSKPQTKGDVRNRFTEGYQLFMMEDELISDLMSEEEKKIAQERCDWLDSCGEMKGAKVVSDVEVNDTLKCLEVVFNRILSRYDSKWRRQFEKGYLEAEGSSEDLLSLMAILPALENYHMEKLMTRWNNFCKQVKDHARKNHVVYAALVSEIQLFLMDFEARLDESNGKLENDLDNSSEDSYIDTRMCVLHGRNKDPNTLSNGKPVEYLINGYSSAKNSKVPKQDLQAETNTVATDAENIDGENNIAAGNSNNSMYYSDSGDEDDNKITSVWDVKIDNFKLLPNLVYGDDSKGRLLQQEESNQDGESDGDSGKPEEIISERDTLVSDVDVVDAEKNSCVGINNEVKAGIFENINGMNTEGELGEKTDSSNVVKKFPPGFGHLTPLKESTDAVSVLAFCGAQYSALSLALAALPMTKVELLDGGGGGLRLAADELHGQFRLFSGLNFGDIELGLNHQGMPLAVRKFEKLGSVGNRLLSGTLLRLVTSLTHVRHEHVLPYVTVCDRPRWLVFATPLCCCDLGQYVRRQRQRFADNLDAWATFTPTLLTMARQLMSGLHFLHSLPQPVVHGNMKPSNVLVDVRGALRLAEFGLHQVLYQQKSPPQDAVIWWARECRVQYLCSWKYECTPQSDVQTAGMLVYFILTMGQHPFGERLPDILQNIAAGVLTLRSQDVNATDLLYWMLSSVPDSRPTTAQVLRHQMFWSHTKKWEFLSTCCGLGPAHHLCPLPLDRLYTDLDTLARRQQIDTVWISVLKKNCECKVGCDLFDDTPSGLLKFIASNLKDWAEIKDVFLELFPSLPLNLLKLIECTEWIDHPEFEPFTRVGPVF